MPAAGQMNCVQRGLNIEERLLFPGAYSLGVALARELAPWGPACCLPLGRWTGVCRWSGAPQGNQGVTRSQR